MTTSFQVYELFIISSFTFFISLPCLSIDTITTNPKHPRFAIDLIHRDSPLSPLYNPEISFWDKAERLYENSVARYNYLNSERSDLYRSAVVHEEFLYFAKLTIGTPAVNVFAIIDIASSLFWIQCRPCLNCDRHLGPFYYRTKSTTFANITCNSSNCSSLPHRSCDNRNMCVYHISYADNSYSYGLLGTEVLSFQDSEGEVMTRVETVIFGCGVNNINRARLPFSGILGLAATELSLVEQFASLSEPKFSYCFANSSDPDAKGNLVIGEDANISGPTTRFLFDNFYRISLVDIKLGSQSLDLSQWETGPFGLMILDAGTIYSFLGPGIHKKLADAISQTIKSFKVEPIQPRREGELCYRGSIQKDLNGFPAMTIRFAGNADLVLETWGTFIQEQENVFCLGFLPTSDDRKNKIMGSMAQQFHNFGFNLDTREVSITRSSCIY